MSRPWMILSGLALALLLGVVAATRPGAETGQSRWTLHSAELHAQFGDRVEPIKVLMLLDSHSGRVFEYKRIGGQAWFQAVATNTMAGALLGPPPTNSPNGSAPAQAGTPAH